MRSTQNICSNPSCDLPKGDRYYLSTSLQPDLYCSLTCEEEAEGTKVDMKKFSKTKVVKEIARERIGQPRPTSILYDKREKQVDLETEQMKEEYDEESNA